LSVKQKAMDMEIFTMGSSADKE